MQKLYKVSLLIMMNYVSLLLSWRLKTQQMKSQKPPRKAEEIQGSARMLQLTMLANKNIASCHFPQPPQTLRTARLDHFQVSQVTSFGQGSLIIALHRTLLGRTGKVLQVDPKCQSRILFKIHHVNMLYVLVCLYTICIQFVYVQ